MDNNTSAFDCHGLHLQGVEILVASLIYLTLVGIFCVTFIDVAIKQCWPKKFLDPVVLKRVLALRAHFPKITRTLGATVTELVEEEKKGEEASATKKVTRSSSSRGRSTSKQQAAKKKLTVEEEEDEEDKKAAACTEACLAKLEYDTIVSMESYSATCCVDEDLVYCLANGDAFSTVSEYCASTVRGYTMLSTFLAMTSTVLGFLWIHNARIFPIGDNYWRYTGIVGYFFCFLTAMIMIPPNPNTVYRNRNILLWGSVKTTNRILGLHSAGMLIFCFLPLVGNFAQLLTLDVAQLPNTKAMWIGFASQMVGTVLFIISHIINLTGLLSSKKTPLRRKHVAIFAELLMIISSMASFLQIETYSTAACSKVSHYGSAIVATLVVVFASFCFKLSTGAPRGAYINGPSVVLLHRGEAVATSGPVPILNYNRQAADLPNVEPRKLKKWTS